MTESAPNREGDPVSDLSARNGPAVIEKLPAGAWWGAVVLYSGAIVVLSHLPGGRDGAIDLSGYDKLVHVLAYGLWASLFFAAITCSAPAASFARRALVSILAACLFGLSDELHQSFVPGRHADGIDLVADAVGATAAVAAWGIVGWWARRGRARSAGSC